MRAPSSHNTQPWLFRLTNDAVELRADRRRALPVNDPEDRELTISCGAALFNMRAAAAGGEMPAEVRLLPEDADRDLLAVVRLGADRVEREIAGLDRWIGERRSVRTPFERSPVPEGLVDQLQGAAAAEGCVLHVVADADRERVVDLVAEGDRVQFGDPNWRRELAEWLRPPAGGDGLPTPALATPVARFVVRRFDVGERTAKGDKRLGMDAPLLVVLTTDRDGPSEWLRAGQALQRMLLLAAGSGLHAGYLNQPCQVERLRPRLRDAVKAGGLPQVLFRLGKPAKPGRRSPRREMREVLLEG